MRAATSSGVSIMLVRTSITPIATSLSAGRSSQRVDVHHVPVGEVEHELVDRQIVEVRQDRLVAGREQPRQPVAPGVAVAEVPGDLGIDALHALAHDVADPLEILVVLGEQRQPGAEILVLEKIGAGGGERLHLLH